MEKEEEEEEDDDDDDDSNSNNKSNNNNNSNNNMVWKNLWALQVITINLSTFSFFIVNGFFFDFIVSVIGIAFVVIAHSPFSSPTPLTP
ncbi:hypothetical protein TURU_098491 [Turdus rufiventris]|nr:hypothetical protein TURU_098491 [Turdus rufiventris]